MENKYLVLKKFGDLKKGATFVPSEDDTEEEITEAVADGFLELITDDGAGSKTSSKKAEVSKVTFSLRNVDAKDRVSERVFTATEHGDDFVKVADEFHKSNEAVVLNRKDE